MFMHSAGLLRQHFHTAITPIHYIQAEAVRVFIYDFSQIPSHHKLLLDCINDLFMNDSSMTAPEITH